MKEKETGIINLDSKIGPGTHWVAYRNGNKCAEYFDSFGLNMPEEVAIYLSTSGKPLTYSSDEIQFSVDIGIFIICWRDKKADRF